MSELKKHRTSQGLTLHGLANLSGVNWQKIWQIEHAHIKIENITLANAGKLAKALGISAEDLLNK